MDYIFEAVRIALDRLQSLSWDDTKELVASLLGALLGAVAGAWAARTGADRDKNRDALLSEIRGVNAASSLSFVICNIALGLKSQHVKCMKERYERALEELRGYKRKVDAGEWPAGTPFSYDADLQTLPQMHFPTDELKRIAFERLTLPSRASAAVIQLHQTAMQLDIALGRRNEFIERTKARAAAGHAPITAQDYFGIPDPEGHVNMDFPDTLNAIFTQVDDVIFYSWLLGNDLADHGDVASTQFRQAYGAKNLPMVRRADYTKAKANALMPEEKDYKMWLDAFQPTPGHSLRSKMQAAAKKWIQKLTRRKRPVATSR